MSFQYFNIKKLEEGGLFKELSSFSPTIIILQKSFSRVGWPVKLSRISSKLRLTC